MSDVSCYVPVNKTSSKCENSAARHSLRVSGGVVSECETVECPVSHLRKCEVSGFAPSKCSKCEMSDFELSKYAKCDVSGFAPANVRFRLFRRLNISHAPFMRAQNSASSHMRAHLNFHSAKAVCIICMSQYCINIVYRYTVQAVLST